MLQREKKDKKIWSRINYRCENRKNIEMNDGHENARIAINHVDCPCTRMFLKVRKHISHFLVFFGSNKKLLISLKSFIMNAIIGLFCRHLVIFLGRDWKKIEHHFFLLVSLIWFQTNNHVVDDATCKCRLMNFSEILIKLSARNL